MDDHKLACVAAKDVDEHRTLIDELLEDGREYWESFYTKKFIFAAVDSGRMQFWIYTNAGIPQLGFLTQINVYSTTKTLMIVWMGGKEFPPRAMFTAFTKTFEFFAQAYECTRIECKARVGLARLFEDQGFKKTSVFLERPVTQITRH